MVSFWKWQRLRVILLSRALWQDLHTEESCVWKSKKLATWERLCFYRDACIQRSVVNAESVLDSFLDFNDLSSCHPYRFISGRAESVNALPKERSMLRNAMPYVSHSVPPLLPFQFPSVFLACIIMTSLSFLPFCQAYRLLLSSSFCSFFLFLLFLFFLLSLLLLLLLLRAEIVYTEGMMTMNLTFTCDLTRWLCFDLARCKLLTFALLKSVVCV